METVILGLISDCEQRSLHTGNHLITEGDRDEDLYVLTGGTVEVIKDGVQVCEVSEKGTVLGEIAALLGLPHMATVRARTPATFKVVRKAREFLCSHPEVFREVAETLAWRLNSTTSHLAHHQAEFSKQSIYTATEPNEPATALKEFREYWRESWKLFERQHYQAAGIDSEILAYHQFDPEEIILKQGAIDGKVYLLRTGTVELLRDGVSLFMVWDKGVLFGEMSALLGVGHTLTVRALEPCTLQVVDSVEQLFETHSDIAWFISALLAKRLLDANKYFSGLMQNFSRLKKNLAHQKKTVLEKYMDSCGLGLQWHNISRPKRKRKF